MSAGPDSVWLSTPAGSQIVRPKEAFPPSLSLTGPLNVKKKKKKIHKNYCMYALCGSVCVHVSACVHGCAHANANLERQENNVRESVLSPIWGPGSE